MLSHNRAIPLEVDGDDGGSRMHKEVLVSGIPVGKSRMRKLMQRYGILPRNKVKFVETTDSCHNLWLAPDLL